MRGTIERLKSSEPILLTTIISALILGGISGCKLDSDKSSVGTDAGGGVPVSAPGNATANQAPTISGVPVTIAKVSFPYAFQPRVFDPDGDELTFFIVGKPEWAEFDFSTGRLSGTPPTGSVGTFTGVQITVSDGATSKAIAPFSIEVVEPAVGSAGLAWQPPTTNEDGTPLTDLSGYVIRYGQSMSVLDRSIRIDNAGMTAFVVEGLVEGTWYFSLSSVTSNGEESLPTGYATIDIS